MAQHERDDDRVVELAGDWDEVGHQVDGQRDVGDERDEQELAAARDAIVSDEPSNEHTSRE